MPASLAIGRSSSALAFHDEGNGYDLFGLDPRLLARASALAGPLYDHYFHVTSIGAEHIPATGPTILVANHGGALPADACLLCLDVLRHTSPPRIPRPVVDRFVPHLPFVNTWLSRLGAVAGTRANVARLLQRGELIAIFPEGSPAMAKPYHRRYRLCDWRVGHAELALRHGATVVPVAITGAEESWPTLARLPFHLFGVPFIPLPATPVPLPARYVILYGESIATRGGDPGAADDPTQVADLAGSIRDDVAELIEQGRAIRRRPS